MKTAYRRNNAAIAAFIALLAAMVMLAGSYKVYASNESFSGFRADYYVSGSLERVDLEYTSYTGSQKDDYSENVFLREDSEAGTIRVVDYITRSHYATDSYIENGKTYRYYVVKEAVLDSTIPGLKDKARAGDTAFTSADKSSLNGISASTTLTIPGPRMVKIADLEAKLGVRTAILSWKSTYETDDPNVSGYTIRVYDSAGSVYRTIDYKNPATVYEGYTVTDLPYKGKYYFTVTPYFDYKGSTFTGDESSRVEWESLQLGPASGSVTKISTKKVRITIEKPQGATGVYVYQYTGGTWRKLGETKGNAYTVSNSTAGKSSYRLLAYISYNGNLYEADEYSPSYSPKANVLTCSYSNSPAAYPSFSHFYRPNKFYYSGNKVVVSGKFINTHVFKMRYMKIKLTVKCQGKVIGTKVIKCNNISSKTIKNMTVKLDKSKTGYDLRAGGIYWSYKVISWN